MTLEDLANTLREAGLGYPEAWEDFPWGETALKVRKKAFAFLNFSAPDHFTLTVKLPQSASAVCAHDHAQPSGYGLGKHGWVTLTISRDRVDTLDDTALLALVDESYRAVAPKTLVKSLAR